MAGGGRVHLRDWSPRGPAGSPGRGLSSLPPEETSGQGPGAEPGLGPVGGAQGAPPHRVPLAFSWGLWLALEVALCPRRFSSLKPMEVWASGRQGHTSLAPQGPPVQSSAPLGGGREGQELACPFPPKLGPFPPPAAETHVLGAAPSRALPPVSPGARPGREGTWREGGGGWVQWKEARRGGGGGERR